MLAGLAVGVWKSREELSAVWKTRTVYEPGEDSNCRQQLDKWHKAVSRCRSWEE